jgi:hypothetical protein
VRSPYIMSRNINIHRFIVFEDIKYEELIINYEPPNNLSDIEVSDFTFIPLEELLSEIKETTNSFNMQFIPERYDNFWPNKSDLACWNCSLNFNCRPWTIPVEKIKNRYHNDFYYTTCGIYCSAGCAMNDLEERNDKRILDKQRSNTYLYEIYSKDSNVSIQKDKDITISRNPSHVWLKRFCGLGGIDSSKYGIMYR